MSDYICLWETTCSYSRRKNNRIFCDIVEENLLFSSSLTWETNLNHLKSGWITNISYATGNCYREFIFVCFQSSPTTPRSRPDRNLIKCNRVLKAVISETAGNHLWCYRLLFSQSKLFKSTGVGTVEEACVKCGHIHHHQLPVPPDTTPNAFC